MHPVYGASGAFIVSENSNTAGPDGFALLQTYPTTGTKLNIGKVKRDLAAAEAKAQTGIVIIGLGNKAESKRLPLLA